MINSLITKYLSTHRRLVIPEFGAFLKKEGSDEVVFVEFLKKDDSVFTGLIVSGFAVSEPEARAITDNFIADMKTRIAATGSYVIEGLGAVYREPGGFYQLRYDPYVKRETITENAQETVRRAEPAKNDSDRDLPGNTPSPDEDGEEVIHMTARTEEPRRQEPPSRINTNVVDADSRERWDSMMGAPSKEERIIPSGYPTKTSPERHVQKEPYSQYEERSEAVRNDRPEPIRTVRQHASDQPKPQRHTTARRPPKRVARKKTDIVMIVAIIAALIAIGSIIFGVLTPNDPIKMLQPTSLPEQVAPMAGDNIDEMGEEIGTAEIN